MRANYMFGFFGSVRSGRFDNLKLSLRMYSCDIVEAYI